MSREEIGYRLAALADGEGCFSITRNRARGKITTIYGCLFVVKMRSDDAPFLRRMAKETGLGNLSIYEASVTDGHFNRKPAVYWKVQSKAGCAALVRIFDEFPLWSKKARDYAIWREAVLYWNTLSGESLKFGHRVYSLTNWQPMVEWKAALVEVRKFGSGDVVLPEIPRADQLEIEARV